MEITKQEKSSSLITSLIISSPIIATFASIYLLHNSYAGIIVMGAIWALLLRHIFFYGLHIKKKAFVFIAYLVIIVVFSAMILSGHTDELALQFIEYGLLGLLVGTIKINSENTLEKCTILMVILAVPCFLLVQTGSTNEYSNDINMGLSYGLMPLLFAVITHFFIYRKNAKILNKIAYIIAAILMIILLGKGTRGVWVCLLFLIYFIFLVKNSYKKNASGKRLAGSFFLIIVIAIVLSNFDYVLIQIINLLSNLGVDTQFLNKSLLLIANGDFSNGRTRIYELAWQGFLASPIWGNGIGSFSNNYSSMGFPFVHNLVLQLLYELGVVFAAPILVTMFAPLKTILFDVNRDKNLGLLIVLFSSSVPMLMLSNELWLNRHLWLMCGYFLSNIISYRSFEDD